MRRLSAVIAAGIAASAAALLVAVGGSAQGPTQRTFELFEQHGQFTEVQNPPKRLSQGDAAVYRAKLEERSGRDVGTDHSSCVFTKAGRHPVALCTASFFLRDGRINAVGGVNVDRAQVLSVAGGTGAYEGAQGTVRIEFVGKRPVLTFNLTP